SGPGTGLTVEELIRSKQDPLARNVSLFDYPAVRGVDDEAGDRAEAAGVSSNFPPASAAKPWPWPPQYRFDGFDESPAFLLGGGARNRNSCGFVDHWFASAGQELAIHNHSSGSMARLRFAAAPWNDAPV